MARSWTLYEVKPHESVSKAIGQDITYAFGGAFGGAKISTKSTAFGGGLDARKAPPKAEKRRK